MVLQDFGQWLQQQSLATPMLRYRKLFTKLLQKLSIIEKLQKNMIYRVILHLLLQNNNIFTLPMKSLHKVGLKIPCLSRMYKTFVKYIREKVVL